MSKFSEHKKNRIEGLLQLYNGIVAGNNLTELVKQNQNVIANTIPSDIITLVDHLILLSIPVNSLKKGINRLLNLLHKTIKEYPYVPPKKNSFLDSQIKNNRELDKRLKTLKPLIREINQNQANRELLLKIEKQFIGLEKFKQHYLIIENIVFPLLEKKWENFRCVQLMWSFHDDILRNIKTATRLLQKNNYNLKQFNRLSGDIFFNMYAIRFREERILFPLMEQTISEELLDALQTESMEIGFPYFQPKNINPSIAEK